MSTTRGQHLIGKELGECVLEKLLGYGGSSAVFLAQPRSTEQKVAIKVFLPRSTMDAQSRKDFYRRFLREAEAASDLHHPSILPIYSYGEQDGLPYIVMPYIEGGTLSEYIKLHAYISLAEAQWYLEQIASALDYAHQHGCVHCDVKPANILLDAEGVATLSDFGIAHLIEADTPTGKEIAKSPDVLMGTPDYISPEQALGLPLDGRSDVYSLGVTLFFLLAGKLPFEADSTIAMALLHVHEKPPALSLVRADISPLIDRVLHKALAKSPDQRYQTAGEFSKAFAEAIVLSANEKPGDRTDKRPRPLVQSDASCPIIAIKPLVERRPVRRRFVVSSRMLIAAILLVTLIFSVTTATILITIHLSKGVQVNSSPTPRTGGSVDSLSNNEDWPVDSTNKTFFFTGQQYHILNASVQDVAMALYAGHPYSDFSLTVTTVVIRSQHSEANYYGVIFRSTPDKSHYYLFEVADEEGGQYDFLRFDGQWKSLASGSAPSLHTGKGQSNTLTVEARNTTFRFSINGVSVGQPITDPTKTTFSSGEIGLYVEQEGTEVAFSHLYVNTLK